MANFQVDPQFGERARQLPGLAPMVEAAGELALERAQEIALEHADTGDYAASLQGELRTSHTGAVYFHIWSDDPGALSIEFGNSKQEGIRALGRAIGEVQGVI